MSLPAFLLRALLGATGMLLAVALSLAGRLLRVPVTQRRWTVGLWGRIGLLAAGTPLVVHGRERLALERPCVIVLNHQSFLDTLIIAVLFSGPVTFIVKRELLYLPFFWICWALEYLIVSRTPAGVNPRAGHAERIARDCKNWLDRGHSMLFFPEGTRSEDGRLLPLKKGAFLTALRCGVPILPVTILNSREALPKGKLRPWPRPIHIVVDEPIDPSGWEPTDPGPAMEAVRAVFQRRLDEFARPASGTQSRSPGP
jgi:1-acyl-sn-glycerol-3-phosphate acyltransferase